MKICKGVTMKRLVAFLLCISIALSAGVLGINAYIKKSGERRIITNEEAEKLENTDYILVLGCRVIDNKSPSHMLEDRLIKGVELYNRTGIKLLMSGDHSSDEYNEVAVMEQYAVAGGVKKADIMKDHSGFSTYESVYRAKTVFGAKKIIIVTQKYHLYRALYIAEELDLEAYGVACDRRAYKGQIWREIREIAARVKDFLLA